MIVYGDRSRTVDVRAELDRLERAWAMAVDTSVERGDRLTAVFIALSELLQGVGDEAPEAEAPFLALTLAIAATLRRPALELPFHHLFEAARAGAPSQVTVKTAEGYAFYALYPETYAQAARVLPPETRFIGVRSIGAGLACVAAEAAGAGAPLTVRPAGHPFARTVALPPVDPAALYAVVDEGPGLSGSSFGAVADGLEAQGVPADRIVFLPSHSDDLGPRASPGHRERWRRARRLNVDFEETVAPELPTWVADLIGEVQALEDLSGGAWRTLVYGPDVAVWPPSAAHQERRKFLARTPAGEFLLKFVGLGASGAAALARARTLAASGLTAEPLGFRRGFLVEPWALGRPLIPADRSQLLAALPGYLSFRAQRLPAPADAGATLADLREMAQVNVEEALGAEAARRLPPPPNTVRPRVYNDARLHVWEWRVRPDGRLLKTDAVDHCAAHDLIGAQPLDWDRAGAVVEHELTAEEAAPLGPVHPFWIAAYAAFQLGLWSLAEDALGGWPEEAARCRRQAERYAARLRAELSG